MSSDLARKAGLLFLLLMVLPLPLAGQGGPTLAVDGREDLDFGSLIPGVPHRIAPLDPMGAGVFRARTGNRTLEVSFVLPWALIDGSGNAIPLHFADGDAARQIQGGEGQGIIFFDPSTPIVISGEGPWVRFHLGGTASPPAGTPAGSYGATLTLTIANLGT